MTFCIEISKNQLQSLHCEKCQYLLYSKLSQLSRHSVSLRPSTGKRNKLYNKDTQKLGFASLKHLLCSREYQEFLVTTRKALGSSRLRKFVDKTKQKRNWLIVLGILESV